MDRQELIKDMKSSIKGASYMNVAEIARYLGKGRNGVGSILKGLECVPVGTEKKYFIPDIASQILNKRQIS